MGSYNRITIALFLLICLVSVGRGAEKLCRRGDLLIPCRTTTSAPTTSIPAASTPTTSTPTPSAPSEDTNTELHVYTEIGITIIKEESSRTTPTQQTLTKSTSAPESTNGTTQNAVWTTVSGEAKPAGLEVTSVHSGVTENTGTGTGVDGSTGGEGFTTREVDVAVTSDGVDTTTGPMSGDLLTVGTTPERATTTLLQTSPFTTSKRVTTSVVATSLPPTTPARLTTAPLQTSPLTTSERATTSVLHTSLPSNCKDLPFPCSTTSTPTASTPTTSTLTTSEGETTSVLHTSLPPTTPERATTALLQTSPLTSSKRATTSVLHTSLPPATPERATTTPLQKSNCQDLPFPWCTTSTPTASTPTTSTLTTYEGETTSVLHTSLPPTTSERATTTLLQTSPLTTSKRATTSVLHTSPPSAERTTTAQQPTTASRASTASPSTTHVAQTTAHDESQESQEDDSMNQISWTDVAEEERNNILTLSFNNIMVEDWMKHHDLNFRQLLSSSLTTNTLRLVPENIYYIRPTPLLRNNILHVSILPRYSSMKRSALPVVPLNETLGALNLTALADALGLPEPPSIIEGVPDFLLPTTQLPTTDLPITQPPTTEPPIIQPSSTRKPPRDIGFLSNPGLFISLVVIATVSIIIIIVGLIYLLCDRRRGRTGEYITNHTPRNSDLELGLDNPVMAENDKNVSNGNHLSSIKGDMESDMIVPYDNFTQEELIL